MKDAIARLLARFAPTWFVDWYLEKFHDMAPFRAGVIEWDSGSTEMVLRDEPTLWVPWGKEGVNLGYNFDGDLIAVQLPGRLSKIKGPVPLQISTGSDSPRGAA